jgi:3-dehydroquinate synthase
VHIGRGLAQALAQAAGDSPRVIVTDSNVRNQPWFARVLETLKINDVPLLEHVVDAGEPSKSFEILTRACSALAKGAMRRDCVIIALGGGVVGDLAGFLAAVYLRGVRFLQAPTTLLAAVDSSVGGKTGINLPEGKNLVGSFYQPQGVFIDLDWLETLPSREFTSGMAEAIKCAIIRDLSLFESLQDGNMPDLEKIIHRCVEIKADVVANDERETNGLRAILNFGHTIGHAIEATAGYGKCLHGEAVAIGMIGAAFLSSRIAGLPEESAEAIRQTIQSHGLPVTRPGIDPQALLATMARDKKASKKGLCWTLCPKIGEALLWPDPIPEMLAREAIACCVT